MLLVRDVLKMIRKLEYLFIACQKDIIFEYFLKYTVVK